MKVHQEEGRQSWWAAYHGMNMTPGQWLNSSREQQRALAQQGHLVNGLARGARTPTLPPQMNAQCAAIRTNQLLQQHPGPHKAPQDLVLGMISGTQTLQCDPRKTLQCAAAGLVPPFGLMMLYKTLSMATTAAHLFSSICMGVQPLPPILHSLQHRRQYEL